MVEQLEKVIKNFLTYKNYFLVACQHLYSFIHSRYMHMHCRNAHARDEATSVNVH